MQCIAIIEVQCNCNVITVCSAFNVSQLQCNCNVIQRRVCLRAIAVCSECNVSQSQCKCNVITMKLHWVTRSMYRNFSVLQCNYNVASLGSAFNVSQLQCNCSVASLCCACNASQLQCNCSVITMQLHWVARASYHN